MTIEFDEFDVPEGYEIYEEPTGDVARNGRKWRGRQKQQPGWISSEQPTADKAIGAILKRIERLS